MSLPRYPEYKDSGVEWLGEVPVHWEVKSIKWLSPVQRGASPRPIDDPKYFDEEGEYAWVRIADVSASDGELRDTTQRLSDLGSSLSVKINPGELFISIAGTVGKPCISTIKACIHDGFVYFPTLQIPPIFLYRIFEAGVCYGGLGKFGTQLNLNTDTIGSIRIALPPADELNTVLAFLDRETGKIDELIAEQQRLVELLAEKRQAVISHAVTKGLNPDVPMKDSGIEWLGDVPAHWEVMSLRRCLLEHRQGYYSELPYVDSGIKLLRITDLRDFGKADFSQCPQVENLAELEPFLLKSSDFVFARTGGAGSFGLIQTLNEPVAYASYLIRFRFADSTHANFLRYFFLSSGFEIAVRQNIHGGVNKNIHAEDIKNQFIALPPIPEQIGIAQLLEIETTKFDTLITEANRTIDLLKERRSALISAAVTGKIDVRTFA